MFLKTIQGFSYLMQMEIFGMRVCTSKLWHYSSYLMAAITKELSRVLLS